MISSQARSVIERSKQIYEQDRERWESEHQGEYLAIEPESGDCFLGASFDDAVKSARASYPARLTHTIRIGHAAAFHIGFISDGQVATTA